MPALLEKINVREMETDPTRWERFELYKGEVVETTCNKPAHGACEVWLVFPERKAVQVYRPDRSARLYRFGEQHVPGEWMKGFVLKTETLFA